MSKSEVILNISLRRGLCVPIKGGGDTDSILSLRFPFRLCGFHSVRTGFPFCPHRVSILSASGFHSVRIRVSILSASEFPFCPGVVPRLG